MKLKHYIMGAAMAAVALVGFASCSDDDKSSDEPQAPNKLTVAEDVRVKIGPENMVLLPVEDGAGNYSAYSLTPEIADVVKGDDGQMYIEGYKNGTAELVVVDAAHQYKRLIVGVYTTDVMQLSHADLSFVTPLGIASTNTECYVVEGNGGYTVKTDSPKVVASIGEESGELTLSAKSGKEEYVATVTVSDCTGLTADILVTVSPTFDAFTQADIDGLIAKDNHDMWLEASGMGVNYNRTQEYPGYISWYGSWEDGDYSDGYHHVGWGDDFGSTWSYGGQYIYYPVGTGVNEEVDGKYVFQYGYRGEYFNLEGKVKVLRNDDTVITVIWWNVDMEKECISRGWVIKEK